MTETAEESYRPGKTLYLFLEKEKRNSPLAEMLHNEGFRVHLLEEEQLNEETFGREQPDLVLININSPPMELISLCHGFRNHYPGPILFLAEQASEMQQIIALEMGIDDFLIEPATAAFILAKIRALLRRHHELHHRSRKIVRLGELLIDAERRQVRTNGQDVELTTREFDVLWCLAEKNREVVSRDDLHQSLYHAEYNGFDRSIDIYISRIRQKIGDDPLHPRYLKTVRGSGYLLTDSEF